MNKKNKFKKSEIGLIPEDWYVKQISDLLTYERSDAYTVETDKCVANGKVPVLTANKSFLLGHTIEKNGIHKKKLKKSEVGMIPEDWNVVKLGQVVIDMKDGGTPSRKKSEHFGGDINWTVVEDIRPEIRETSEKLSELGLKNSSAKVWPEETIIISLGASIGHVGILKQPAATKQGLCGIISDKTKIIPLFLAELLRSKKKFIQGLSSGSTIKEVRPSTLKNLLRFPIPHLKEQKKIAKILSTVDQAIERTEDIIKETERLQKGLMTKVFREVIHKKKLKSHIGVIFKECETKRLGSFLKLVKGKKPPAFADKSETNANPYILISSFKNHEYQKYVKDTTGNFCSEDDVLLVWDGARSGLCSIGHRGYLGSTIAALKQPKRVINPVLLYQFMKSCYSILNNHVRGTGIPHLEKDFVLNLKMPIPKLKEQEKIAEIFSTIDRKISIERHKKVEFEIIKKGLMQKLLTGKIRVKVDD